MKHLSNKVRFVNTKKYPRHNIVEMCACRKGVLDKEFWENLIILAMLRAGACETDKEFGLRVAVDVEQIGDEIEEEDGVPERVELTVREYREI